jgi:uncharacterized protein
MRFNGPSTPVRPERVRRPARPRPDAARAARRRILENPAAHTVLLRRVAVVCLGITVLGALPYAMVATGVLHVTPNTVDSLSMLQQASGSY